MRARAWPRIEPLALIAAALAAAMAASYVWLVHQQGDQPLPWVLALLLTGALLAVYGAERQLPHRPAALLAAGAALITLGLPPLRGAGRRPRAATGRAAPGAGPPSRARRPRPGAPAGRGRGGPPGGDPRVQLAPLPRQLGARARHHLTGNDLRDRERPDRARA